MYNPNLNTFLAVAEEKSFAKAAERLFISHTAVRRQINQLEEDCHAALFYRNTEGVFLTEAGEVLYHELPGFIRYSENILAHVRDVGTYPQIIRLGTSPLYPCDVFMNLWDEIDDGNSPFRFKLINIEDSHIMWKLLGNDADIMIGVCGNTAVKNCLRIGSFAFGIAVPRSHPFARRHQLSLAELSGCKVRHMQAGYSPENDVIRDYVRENRLPLDFIDATPVYDIHTFNDAAEADCMLLAPDCWKKVHPAMKMIPLKEKFYIPCGVLYSLTPSRQVEEFISYLEKKLDGRQFVW